MLIKMSLKYVTELDFSDETQPFKSINEADSTNNKIKQSNSAPIAPNTAMYLISFHLFSELL